MNNTHEKDIKSIILSKLNKDTAIMLLALIIAISGISMIFKGIKDEGLIDLKSPFISGQVKSGFVGVLLVFLSTVISIAVYFKKPNYPKQNIKLSKGDTKLEWEGDLYYLRESKNILDVISSYLNVAFNNKKQEISNRDQIDSPANTTLEKDGS